MTIDTKIPRDRSRSRALAWGLGLLVAVGVLWGLASLFDRDRNVPTASRDEDFPSDMDTATQPVAGTVVESAELVTEEDDLADEPERFDGKSVILEGEVNEVVNPRLFKIDTDGMIGGDDVLVMNDTGVHVTKDQRVRVRGLVDVMARREVETKLGGGLADGLFVNDEGQAVVSAEAIETVAH